MSNLADVVNDSDIRVVIDTVIKMLISGSNIFVTKNDFTPEKINAREGHSFKKNECLFEQPVDLCWTSRKGFTMGVVFYGAGRDIEVCDSFSSGNMTFIAKFELSEIFSHLCKHGMKATPENISQVFSETNTFSSWLLWPQYPLVSNQIPAQMPEDEADMQSLTRAYEQWFQRDIPSWDNHIEQGTSSSQSITAVYKGCKQSQNTGELVYRFSVKIDGKSEHYHLISYEHELFLLDYMYDSVPLDTPKHNEIFAACQARMPHR